MILFLTHTFPLVVNTCVVLFFTDIFYTLVRDKFTKKKKNTREKQHLNNDCISNLLRFAFRLLTIIFTLNF